MTDDGRDEAGYTPGQIFALKIAIAVMTLAIFAGLGVMAYTIAVRATNQKPEAGASLPASLPPVDLKALYGGPGAIASGVLPPGGHITALTPWNDKLLLAVEDPNGASLLVFDPKSGHIEPLARLQPSP